MTRGQARFLHLGTLLVGGTGLVYGWMRYFVPPADEFSIIGHPWQPHLQHAHILVAPLLVFGCGVVWSGHIWTKIRAGARARRLTGWTLTGLLVPMILSGYALQVSVDESWRTFWIWMHVATSVGWLLLYLVHQLRPKRVAIGD